MFVSFKKEAPLFEHALSLHQKGQVAEAERLYRQILTQDPNHPDTLHMIGLLLYQSGRAAEGVAYVERSIALAPGAATALSNLGEIKRSMGQLQEAVESCRRALALDPTLAAAMTNLAMALYQQGKYAEALPFGIKAVGMGSVDGAAHAITGVILMDSGRAAEGIGYLEEGVKRCPGDVNRISALGLCYERLELWEKAFTCHQQASAISPNDPRMLLNLGALLARLERYENAEPWFSRAVEKDPNSLIALNQLAGVKLGLRKFEEAVELCRKSIAVQPIASDAYATLGESLMGMGKFDECIAEMDKASAIRPTFAIHQTKSNSLVRRGTPAQGLAELELALACDPQNAILHFNKAIILLLMGRMGEAWLEYEWRWQHPRMGWRNRQFNRPKWDGTPMPGKRILLHAEQGMGDTIFFGRYITQIAERGLIPVVFVQNSVLDLVKTIKGAVEVVGEGSPMPVFDVHLPLMSAPGIFKSTEETVPAEVPYISTNPEKSAYWKEELSRRTKKLKVGLVWEGGPFQPENFLRSASLAAYAPLAEVEGVAFFGLQKGTAEAQSKNPPAGMDFTDLGPHLKDFSDTAAILENLDLLISIDTSVVHVAGALGKPAWMMLAFSPGHMWMLKRLDSPWYPTFRLFRQPAFKDWATPVGQIKAELEKLVKSRG